MPFTSARVVRLNPARKSSPVRNTLSNPTCDFECGPDSDVVGTLGATRLADSGDPDDSSAMQSGARSVRKTLGSSWASTFQWATEQPVNPNILWRGLRQSSKSVELPTDVPKGTIPTIIRLYAEF